MAYQLMSEIIRFRRVIPRHQSKLASAGPENWSILVIEAGNPLIFYGWQVEGV